MSSDSRAFASVTVFTTMTDRTLPYLTFLCNTRQTRPDQSRAWIRRAVTQTLARCYAGDDYAADPRVSFKQVRAAVAAAATAKLRLFTESRTAYARTQGTP